MVGIEEGYNKIIEEYQNKCRVKSDINEHLPTLCRYASMCEDVVEFGVRGIVSTWAILAGRPKRLRSYDIADPSAWGGNIDDVIKVTEGIIDFSFTRKDVLNMSGMDIISTDMLFIDTWHTGAQLTKELSIYANCVRKYIILHDTHTFWTTGEDGYSPGLGMAVLDFLAGNVEWGICEAYHNNNGLLILRRFDDE